MGKTRSSFLPEGVLRVSVVDVSNELCDDLRVGLGLEPEALGLEEGLDVLVVGDDPVVDDDEAVVVARGLRVRVALGGLAVGGPAGVRDAHVDVEDLVEVEVGAAALDLVAERDHLARLADQIDLAVRSRRVDTNAFEVKKESKNQDKCVSDDFTRVVTDEKKAFYSGYD